MAVLTQMPQQHIIDGFKGVVDFYEYKGIPCARKWPVWHPRQPSDTERAAQEAFAYINRIASQLPEYIKDQYHRMAVGTPWTWKDLLVKAYIHGLDY